MSNQPPHNQVWIHPDGTWSSMRRDGSFNFIYAVPIILEKKGEGCTPWVNKLTEYERACVRMGADPRNFSKG